MITWRPWQPSDTPALRALHARQCEAIGLDTPFPDLRDPRYFLTRVAERDGAPLGALAAHATTELLWISADALLLREALRRRHEWRAVLRSAGAGEISLSIHVRTLRQLEPLLQRLGFRRSHPDYATFFQHC